MTSPFAEMTKEEKLRMMEVLWIDLTPREEEFLSPNWHEDVLKAREKRVQSEKEVYQDWEQAKKELRKTFRKVQSTKYSGGSRKK